MRPLRSAVFLLALSATFLAACDCNGPDGNNTCTTDRECAADEACVDGRCQTLGDAGPGVDAGPMMCAAAMVCGAGCCAASERCGTDQTCCDPADLCGGACCGGADQTCVADACVLDCGDREACGSGGDAVCCGADQVCLLGACTDPGIACASPFDCPEGEYCEASIGRCLPRQTGVAECEYQPETGAFELVEEWHWAGDPEVLTGHDQVMQAPMVANLDDDNGDGSIDENDIPDVVFVTFHPGRCRPEVGRRIRLGMEECDAPYSADGVVRAISGADGSRLWPTAEPGYRAQPSLEVAIADIRPDSPGPEIIGCTFTPGATNDDTPGNVSGDPPHLTILSATGTILQRFDSSPAVGCGRPSVADMDGDGVAEIVVGNTLVQADGSGAFTVSGLRASSVPVLYDMDGDPELELVGLNGVADQDGTLLWVDASRASQSGYVAVADVDLDGDPDLIATSVQQHDVIVYDGATGAVLAGPIEITPDEIEGGLDPTRLTGGGPPTIANFDADPEPEFALAGGYAYVVYNHDGTRLWYAENDDESSRATGSSVFDFEGDGFAEVLYNDEYRFRSFRGPDGSVYLDRCNTSGTLIEYPIVVDVDNDDHAEIVLVENNYARTTCLDGVTASTTGVRAYGHPENQWVRTRRIWNQHAYHVTNINEDGTLPLTPDRNYATAGLNNFRQNVQPNGLFDAPDLVLRDPSYSTAMCGVNALVLRVRVVNEGRAGAPAGVPVAFYVDGAFVGRVVTTRSLLAGASEVVQLTFSPVTAGQMYAFTAVINDPGHEPLIGLNECRPDNNGSDPVTAICALIE